MNPGISCRICGSSKLGFLWKGKDRFYHLPGSFDLYRCEKCGLVFIHPFLSDAEIAGFYPQDYYSYGSSDANSKPQPAPGSKIFYYLKHPLKAANALIYSKLLRQNADIAIAPGSAVLDVGCGDGQYLQKKRAEGHRLFGVDISSAALERLKKLLPEATVHCGPLWDAHFPAAYFDLIHLSHVVEHVAPIEQLASEIQRLLKPAGRAVIKVPNSASLTFRLFGPLWIHLDTPRHVYVFSKKNMRRFLEQRGFLVESCRTTENSFSILGGLIYLFNALSGGRKRIDNTNVFWDSEIMKLLLSPYCMIVNAFGCGDTMEFVIKRNATP